MVFLSKIIEELEMVNDEIDCYYNPRTNEIFYSNIGEYCSIDDFSEKVEW